jgi:adhesin/invasin
MKKLIFYTLNAWFCSSGLVVAFVFILVQSSPGAQVVQILPFYDSFDYNPGSAGLASASSTVWEACPSTSNLQVTTNSLTLAGYVSSAGNSVFGATHGIRFAGTQFTSQTAADGKTLYVSFLYQVTAYPANGTNGVIAFLDATNITANTMPGTAALALLIDKTGHIGINTGSPSTNGAQYEASATALNNTVLVVARYTFHTSPTKDTVDLWVNPSSANYGAGTAPAPDKTITSAANWPSLAYFSLSYNNNDSAFGEKWDEVRIGTTWAQAVPSSNTPGSASATHSLMVSASPASIVASGSSTSTVKMQARDLNGVNLTSGGSTVTFATTVGTVGGTTDNGDGTYQAILTSSTTVTNATVTAKLGGTAIATIGTATNSASLAVSFVLGPVSASVSTAVANPTSVAADGVSPSTITITALDAYGHPLAGQSVSLSVSGSGNTVSTPANTGANGQTTATITSTVGETKSITVTIGSTQINAQPTVTFILGGVSTIKSTAVASPNTGLVADGISTSTITVTAEDGSGNLLTEKTVVLAVSGSGNTLTQLSSTTDANGQITATLASTMAGAKTITVTIDGTVINAQPTVTFVAGTATQIVFTSGPVTTPVNLTIPSVVVQIEDVNGNAVPQSGATVTLALSAGTLSGTNPQLTDASGKATFNDLSIPTISYGLTLTATVPGFSPIQSGLFDAPPKTFYKISNTAALNLAASWTATRGGAGPAGPPAADGIGVWDTNNSGATVDIGASASWYGLVMAANGAVTISDSAGGHTLTLGAGSLDGSAAVHSFTMSNNIALAADQTWKWTVNSYILTLVGNLDNGGHQFTINGLSVNGPEKFNGAITGSGGLTLTSNAAVTLSGMNTYSGNTTISGGKLIINTNGSIANTPNITLASGTTLDISAASPFTLFSGQTLSGDMSGNGNATIVTKGSSLTLAASAQAAFTAVGNASTNGVSVGKLTVQGSVTLIGNAITVNVTSAPLPSGTYTLMTATNGFTTIGTLPMPTITGQGVAGGCIPQIVINGQNLQLAVGFSVRLCENSDMI